MKVVLIYRLTRQGAYSIETVFHTIASELRKHVEVIEYVSSGRSKVLNDVQNLQRLNADIYHVTGDINYLVPLLPRGRTILTVHDIGHFLFGLGGIKKWIYQFLWLSWPLRFASVITAISFETKRNILAHFSVDEGKVVVIEDCYSPTFKRSIKYFNAECPVILQVGTRPYKNVPRLIEALRGLRCRLVLVGKLDALMLEKLEESKIDYTSLVDLTEERLYEQYARCDLVSFVSVGEGFGMPIIEAQAIGRPLITSNVRPLCQVAGDGACLVDPLNAADIRKGVLRILSESDYRNDLVRRGFLNVQRYAPETIVNKYLALYRRLTDET